MIDEEAKNLVDLIEALRKMEEEQKHMTEEEKENNAVKISDERGDIWY